MELAHWQRDGRYFMWRSQRIFYRDDPAADEASDVLICLHGFPTASWDWHRLWPGLRATHRLIAPDFLGYGFSSKPKNHAYSTAEQTDIVLALLAHLGIGRVHVLAHDFGDSVAQELLARALEPERRLSLSVCSVCYLNGGLFMEAARPRLIQRLLLSPLGPWLSRRLDYRRFARSFAAIFGPDTQPDAAELADFWQLIHHDNGHHLGHALIQYIPERHRQRARWVAAMQRTTVPQRLVIGLADPVSGWRIAWRYRELLPSADVIELPGIGHYPQIEAPEAVLTAHAQFLHQIAGLSTKCRADTSSAEPRG